MVPPHERYNMADNKYNIQVNDPCFMVTKEFDMFSIALEYGNLKTVLKDDFNAFLETSYRNTIYPTADNQQANIKRKLAILKDKPETLLTVQCAFMYYVAKDVKQVAEERKKLNTHKSWLGDETDKFAVNRQLMETGDTYTEDKLVLMPVESLVPLKAITIITIDELKQQINNIIKGSQNKKIACEEDNSPQAQ